MASDKLAGGAYVDDRSAVLEVGLCVLDRDESGAPVNEKSRKKNSGDETLLVFMADSLPRRGHTWHCGPIFFAGRAGRASSFQDSALCFDRPSPRTEQAVAKLRAVAEILFSFAR